MTSARSSPVFSRFGYIVALLLTSCAPSLKEMPVSESAAQIEEQKQREMALSLWVKRQDRLGVVVYRLTNAAADLCDQTRTAYGVVIHDISSYPDEYQQAARAVFRLGTRPVVRFVQPDFPAARAGMQVGDTLEELGGKSLADKSTRNIIDLLGKADPKDSVRVRVRRNGILLDLAMMGVPACDYPVSVTQDDIVNAYADGEKVYIASGMMRFAETDDELALVVGHELAHNALGHIGKKKGNALLGALLDVTIAATTGINDQGVFSSAGAGAFSQATGVGRGRRFRFWFLALY
jgi:Zn-dependent protease with chaperone function